LSAQKQQQAEEELHEPYSSPNTIRVMKSRMRKYAHHMTSIREERNAHRILVGKNRRVYLKDLGANGRIIHGILNKRDGRVWGRFIRLRTGTNAGSLRTRQLAFGFHKMWGTSRVSKNLLASELLCRTKLLQ
jgi:hypothetical protein